MKELENLKRILGCLSNEEKNYCLKIMKVSSENINRERFLYSKLFNLALKKNHLSYEEIQIQIYGEIKEGAFRKLISRLMERILDIILLNENINENSFYDKRAQDIFMLRKKLIQFDMLSMRGLSTFSSHYLEKIISKSIKYEYYDILLFALYKKRRYYLINTDKNEYKRLTTQINYFENCRSLYYKAEDIYNSFTPFNSFKVVNKDAAVLLNSIQELKKSLLKYKSNSINYLLYLIKAKYYSEIDNIKNLRGNFIELVDFLHSNNAILTKHKLGSAFLNIGNCDILGFDFSSARQNLIEAAKQFGNDFSNIVLVKELSFLVTFFENNLKKSSLYLKVISEYADQNKLMHFVKPRLNLYEAVLNTLDMKYIDSNINLLNISAIDFEDIRWKMAEKIISIMNNIELEKFDLVDHQIENLRKYVERLKVKNLISKRNELLTRVLLDLSRSGYNFKSTARSKEKILSLLNSSDPDYRWQIKTPEMIVFHEWFRAKQNNVPYNHGEVMERMKKQFAPQH